MTEPSSENHRPLWPLFMIGLGVGLMLIVLIALVIQLVHNQPADQNQTTSSTPEEISLTDIPRVSLTDAKKAFDEKSAIFIDVRDPQAYQASHIPGAINVPLAEFGTHLTEFNKSDWIIPYCT